MLTINYQVERKIIICKPLNEIHSFLTSFHNWNFWSPWICLDSKAITKVSDNPHEIGHCLEWSGTFIGSGVMTLMEGKSDTVNIDLLFKTPFKSTAQASFKLKETGNETEVTWKLESTLPFFMFFLKKMLMAFLGRDYERGLVRLKEYLEIGTIHCVLSEVSAKPISEFYVCAIPMKSNLSTLSIHMNQAFKDITEDIKNGHLPLPDGLISVYHHLDPITGNTEFGSGAFYVNKLALSKISNSKYQITTIPAHQALSLALKGPYHHLPTAWAKIIAYSRAVKIKESKKIPLCEIYQNSPEMVAKEDILTEIRLPLH